MQFPSFQDVAASFSGALSDLRRAPHTLKSADGASVSGYLPESRTAHISKGTDGVTITLRPRNIDGVTFGRMNSTEARNLSLSTTWPGHPDELKIGGESPKLEEQLNALRRRLTTYNPDDMM